MDTLFILCGGKATRLMGVNDKKPKALVKVNSKSLLSIIIDKLNFFQKITVSYHSNKDLFEKVLMDELIDFNGSSVHYFEDKFQYGTAFAVCQFIEYLRGENFKGNLCVINGDTLFSNFSDLFIDKNNHDIILSTSLMNNGIFNLIDYEQGEFKITKKTIDAPQQCLNGIIKRNSKHFDNFRADKIIQGTTIEKYIIEDIQGKCDLFVENTDTQFIDAGTIENYLTISNKYLNLKSNYD